MPSTMEQRRLGLVKETVRGTAVTPADRWRAITADTELNYSLALQDDETKRGINAMFPAAPTVKSGEGTIKFPVRASEMGEFLQMAIGDPITTTPGGATLARLHTFTAPVASVLRPSYTIHLDRGLNTKRYVLSQVNQLTLSQDPDGLMQMEAAMLFKTEEAGDIGSPVFTGESEEAEPDQISVLIDSVAAPDVRQFTMVMDNQMFAQRTFSGSKDIKDIVCVGPMKLSGSFELFFESEAERVKFLAATQVSLDFEFVGSLIEAGQNYELKIAIDKAKYRALPFGELDGLLGASVEWEAEYDVANSRLFRALLKNQVTAY